MSEGTQQQQQQQQQGEPAVPHEGSFAVMLAGDMNDLGFTPSTLGRVIGTHNSSVKRWTEGEGFPSLPMFGRIRATLMWDAERTATALERIEADYLRMSAAKVKKQ